MLNSVWHNAWTKAWGHCQWIAGAALTSAPVLNELVSNSDFKSAIVAFNPPSWVGPSLIILGVITFIASEHKKNA